MPCTHRWTVFGSGGEVFCGKCSDQADEGTTSDAIKNREHALTADCWCDPRIEHVSASG